MSDPNQRPPGFTSVIAHRGARAFAPENTLEAIEKAAAVGADAVEIDVQMSSDGALVVLHDDQLIRCTDAERRFPDRSPWIVADFSLAEIQSLDAGGWFAEQLSRPSYERQPYLQDLTADEIDRWIREDLANYASGRIRVPVLADCLAACRRLHLELHVELKVIPRFWPGLTERVVREVERFDGAGWVVISSFDHQQLGSIRDLSPGLRTAVLTSDRLFRPADYLKSLGAEAYNPGAYGETDTVGFGSVDGRLDVETIRDLRAAGFSVNVWTENDPPRMRVLLDAGVTGIFTDYPNRLRALLD
jgi:glycerophosphoryl diester phosphodiesterase